MRLRSAGVLLVGAIGLGVLVFALKGPVERVDSGDRPETKTAPDAGDRVALVRAVVVALRDAGADPAPRPVVRVRVMRGGAAAAGARVLLGTQGRVSDANGQAGFFDCVRSPGEEDNGAWLRAESGDLSSNIVWVDCDAPPREEVTLKLEPAASFTGYVRAVEDRSAIAGARVWLSPPAGGGATTDEKGHFVLKGLGPGLYALTAKAPGRLAGTLEAIRLSPNDEREVTVELEGESFVQGRLLDPEHAPIAREVVSVVNPDGGVLGSGTTGREGVFRIGGLHPGQGVLEVVAPGYARYDRRVPIPSEGLELRLTKGGAIEGEVDLHADPLPDAEVTLKAQTDLPVPEYQARSGAGGRYRIELLPPGSYRARAKKAGMGEITQRVTIVDGEVAEVDFRLEAWVESIRGQVIDADTERPIEGASVHALDSSAVTDINGEFELPDLHPGTVPVHFDAVGYVPDGKELPCPSHNEVMGLHRVATVSGRVIDSTGNPITSFEITNVRNDFHPARVAASDGRFHVQLGPSREPYLWISAAGFVTEQRPFDFEPGGKVEYGDVTLRGANPILILVTGPDGEPVAGATVHSEDKALGMTDDTGQARCFIRSGRHCFFATHPLFAASDMGTCFRRVYDWGSPTFALHLRAAGWISGQLLHDGQPVAATTVLDSTEGVSAVTGEDGRFRLGPLSAGPHTLATVDGASLATLDLVAGQELSLAIPVP